MGLFRDYHEELTFAIYMSQSSLDREGRFLQEGVQVNQKWILICAALAALMLPVGAQAQTKAVQWTGETAFATGYLLGDVGKMGYRGPGQKASITAAFADGWFVNLWAWRAYADNRSGLYAEVDYTLGYNRTVGDYDLNFSISYYDLPRQFQSHGDVFQPIVGVSRSFVFGWQTVTPYVNFKGSFPVGYRSGLLSEVGVNDRFDLSEHFSLIAGARVLYDTGAYNNTAGWNVRGDLAGIVHLDPTLDLKFGVQVATPISHFTDPLDPRRTEVVGWTGITKRFP